MYKLKFIAKVLIAFICAFSMMFMPFMLGMLVALSCDIQVLVVMLLLNLVCLLYLGLCVYNMNEIMP